MSEWLTTKQFLAAHHIGRTTLYRWRQADAVECRHLAPRGGVRWRLLSAAELAHLAKVRRGVVNVYGEYV